jgi:stress-induced morphogen
MGGTSVGSTTNSPRPDAGTDAAAGDTALPDGGHDASGTPDVPNDTTVRPDTPADRASDALADNCLCLGKPAPVCTPTGHLSYTLARAPTPTADQTDAYKVIGCAMDMAVAYYNCYATITGSVQVSYNTGVATADGNINGSIRFGSSRSYMQCATAMHEIAHTQGIGTASQWAAHVSGGLFAGTNTAAQLQTINATLAKPLYTATHADGMHFWPYGLNYESEATGTDILVDHCQMVMAIRKDLGI